MISPRTQKIFDAYESGVPIAEIEKMFEIDNFEIHRIIYRMRKHRAKKAGEVVE